MLLHGETATQSLGVMLSETKHLPRCFAEMRNIVSGRLPIIW